jgi:lipopolysaccharide/colanic/teichoic acid biosynthesis glycosyltransferase
MTVYSILSEEKMPSIGYLPLLVYVGDRLPNDLTGGSGIHYHLVQLTNSGAAMDWFKKHKGSSLFAIIIQQDLSGINGIDFCAMLKEQLLWDFSPVFILSSQIDDQLVIKAKKAWADDLMLREEIHSAYILDRVKTHGKLIAMRYGYKQKETKKNQDDNYHIPFAKRCFDVLVSSILLLLLSPLLLITALAIRLESKGPIFYTSKRVGRGYQLIDFIKFRSMYLDADKRLKDLGHLNQYGSSLPNNDLEKSIPETLMADTLLVHDGNQSIPESAWLTKKASSAGGTFVKIANDPRVTKVGRFIRNTSIDELPQLFNVLRGDMSIVGNRPLPLYEAEYLTTDHWAVRFLAPAGITGLWQVSKRGAASMSEEERKQLDNTYALKGNCWFDLRLLLMTIPALLQKENV